MRSRTFTLIELLVVVAIIALLISILLPALNMARQRAKVTQCQANLRSQGAAIMSYVSENNGGLPPRLSWYVAGGQSEILLINGILAKYLGQPFVREEVGFPKPTGIFRCPDVLEGEGDDERWTHSGYLHHAPNRYLFNMTYYYAAQNRFVLDADCAESWDSRFGQPEWRKLERVRNASRVMALMDNVNFDVPSHGHREARESIGTSCDVIFDPGTDSCGDNRASHGSVGKRPTLLADGHCEALPTTRAYWQDLQVYYMPQFGNAIEATLFYEQEVRRFHWYLDPSEWIDARPD